MEVTIDQIVACLCNLKKQIGNISIENPWWMESQGDVYVQGKPFELVSSGGNGVADDGKGAIFDSDGGLAPETFATKRTKQIGFDASIYVGVGEGRLLTSGDDGKVLYYTGEPAIVLTAHVGLPAAFSCKIIQEGVGSITIAVVDLDLRHVNGHTRTQGQDAAIYISRRGNRLKLEGETAP